MLNEKLLDALVRQAFYEEAAANRMNSYNTRFTFAVAAERERQRVRRLKMQALTAES